MEETVEVPQRINDMDLRFCLPETTWGFVCLKRHDRAYVCQVKDIFGLSLPERLMATEIDFYFEIRVGSLPISLTMVPIRNPPRNNVWNHPCEECRWDNLNLDMDDGLTTRRYTQGYWVGRTCSLGGMAPSFEELLWGSESSANLASPTELDITILRQLPSLYQLGVRYQSSPKWMNE